jgi:stage II sporulation protein M
MKSQIRFSLETFFLGVLVGLIVAKIGGPPHPLTGLRFSLDGVGKGFFDIILNNLVAATATAFGPVVAMRLFNIRSRADSIGLAFLYMIPILILFINGAATGYIMGVSLGSKPFLDVILSILPHGVLEIPAIVLAGAVGLKNIDEIDRGEIQGTKVFMTSVALLLLAGGIEAQVTPQLAGIESRLTLVDVDVPGRIVLGETFLGQLTLLNQGLREKECSLIVTSKEGTSSQPVVLPKGETTLTFNMTPGTPGQENFTLILWDGRPILEETVEINVSKPRVSIVKVALPQLFAGEDAGIPLYIENLDANRTVVVEFASSTGAVDYKEVNLSSGGITEFVYNTTLGQPGARNFVFTLYEKGVELDREEVNLTVHGLRISPRIRDIHIPELRSNRTANITVTLENTGTKEGNITVLVFEAELAQLLQRGSLTQIYLSSSHLEKRIWETSGDIPLKPGEVREVHIPVTPERPHRGTLLLFALRREVVSDAAVEPIEVL